MPNPNGSRGRLEPGNIEFGSNPMSSTSTEINDFLAQDHDDLGEYQESRDASLVFNGFSMGSDAVEKDKWEYVPQYKWGFLNRAMWAVYASHEMLTHWLCPRCFNARDVNAQLLNPAICANPFYWLAFLITYLSLWLGREIHRPCNQADPAANREERRQEYECRVHWVYTTTGAMGWVLVRSICTIIYEGVYRYKIDWAAVVTTWIIVACYIGGNSIFLEMIKLRNMVGTRTIIIFNGVFSVCMAISVIIFAKDIWVKHSKYSQKFAILKAYQLLIKVSAVAFFLVATLVYCKLWSFYKFTTKRLSRRILETLPAVVSACVLIAVLYLGLFYDSKRFQPYIWATFA